jgi:hypothetical protein
MTYREYKKRWMQITESQRNWIRGKAKWEHMTLWAVMNNWTTPKPEQLNEDGSWRPPNGP